VTVHDSAGEQTGALDWNADRRRRMVIISVGVVCGASAVVFTYAALRLWAITPTLTAAHGNPLVVWLSLSACALALAVGLSRLGTRDPVTGLLLASAAAVFVVALWGPATAFSTPTIVISAGLGTAFVPLIGALGVVSSPGAPGARSLLAALFIAAAAAALLPALFTDPAAHGCAPCPPSPLVLADDPGIATALTRGTALIVAAAAGTLAAVITVRSIAGRHRARRSATFVPIAAAACLAVSAGHFGRIGFRSTRAAEDIDVLLLAASAVALAVVAVGLLAGRFRAATMRLRAASLVAELTTTPSAGAQDLLRRALGEPLLVLGFPLSDGTVVGRDGCPISPHPGSPVTVLTRTGTSVAMLSVPAGGGYQSERIHQATIGAWIAIENDRSIAVLAFREHALRNARLRLAAASDRERRNLFRDLHDDAQQRLVALSIDLELLRARERHEPMAPALSEAAQCLRTAVAELRRVASLSWSTLLAERGLADAVQALDESVPWPVRLDHAATTRLDPLAETAGYAAVCAAAGLGEVNVRIHADGPTHVLEIDCAVCPENLDALTDRVAGAGGDLHVIRLSDGAAQLRLEFADPDRPALRGEQR